MKKFVTITIAAIIAAVIVYTGMTIYMNRKADAEEADRSIIVKTMRVENDWYTPYGEFRISKSSLYANVELTKNRIVSLNNGDIMIDFTISESRHWIVVISDPAVKKEVLKRTK